MPHPNTIRSHERPKPPKKPLFSRLAPAAAYLGWAWSTPSLDRPAFKPEPVMPVKLPGSYRRCEAGHLIPPPGPVDGACPRCGRPLELARLYLTDYTLDEATADGLEVRLEPRSPRPERS